MKMRLKKIFFIILFFISFIEIGMRLSIYKAINDVTPEGSNYDLSIITYYVISPYTCFSDQNNNYKSVFYTYWLLSRVSSNVICKYKSQYILLRVDTDKHIFDYHWSFRQWRFVDSYRELLEKNSHE